MPITTRSWTGDASRQDLSVEDLEAELAKRRAQAEQAKADAAERARQAEAARRRAEQDGRAGVAALTQEATGPLPEDDWTPLPETRVDARRFLHAAVDLDGVEALRRLSEVDQVVAVLADRQQRAGRLLGYLAGQAGLPPDHDLYAEADRLECAAWSALVARARVLAGEVD